MELRGLTQEDLTINNTVYQEFFDYGFPDGWLDESREKTYQDLVKIIGLTGAPLVDSSILDLGCGTGGLFSFLRHQGYNGRYLGVDIFPGAAFKAKKLHPEGEFALLDVLSPSFVEKFDFVFACGTFSVRLGSDNYDFLEAYIRKMKLLGNIGVAFTFLPEADYRTELSPKLFFYEGERVLEICKKLPGASRVITQPTSADQQTLVYLIN